MKEIVAIFDFDGTLSSGSSGLRFFRYLLGKKTYSHIMKRNFFWNLLYLSTWGNRYALNKITRSIFRDKSHEEILHYAEKYSKKIMPKFHYEQIMQRLDWHQKQGHRIILITGALDIYITPWAKQVEIKEVFATRLEVSSEGLLTGNIENGIYLGKNKLSALQKLLGEHENYITYVYADSYSDRFLLAAANYAYWIRDPNESLDKSLLNSKKLQRWKK
ncbi:MAG: HAD family hydrolase [Legionella sp.]